MEYLLYNKICPFNLNDISLANPFFELFFSCVKKMENIKLTEKFDCD